MNWVIICCITINTCMFWMPHLCEFSLYYSCYVLYFIYSSSCVVFHSKRNFYLKFDNLLSFLQINSGSVCATFCRNEFSSWLESCFLALDCWSSTLAFDMDGSLLIFLLIMQVFILFSDGSLYILCPIVPFGRYFTIHAQLKSFLILQEFPMFFSIPI